MKKVIVWSQNPVKIKAVKEGFEAMFPEEWFEVVGISATSGVNDQPMTDIETFTWAKNRAIHCQEKHPEADFWVGVEGWLFPENDQSLTACAWVYVVWESLSWKARSATFSLPPEVVQLIHQWHELAEADSIVFGRENSKRKNGAVGFLTGDVVTRTDYYAHPVKLALIPFKNTHLFG